MTRRPYGSGNRCHHPVGPDERQLANAVIVLVDHKDPATAVHHGADGIGEACRLVRPVGVAVSAGHPDRGGPLVNFTKNEWADIKPSVSFCAVEMAAGPADGPHRCRVGQDERTGIDGGVGGRQTPVRRIGNRRTGRNTRHRDLDQVAEESTRRCDLWGRSNRHGQHIEIGCRYRTGRIAGGKPDRLDSG